MKNYDENDEILVEMLICCGNHCIGTRGYVPIGMEMEMGMEMGMISSSSPRYHSSVAQVYGIQQWS